jgi:hypothetical protein
MAREEEEGIVIGIHDGDPLRDRRDILGGDRAVETEEEVEAGDQSQKTSKS